MEPRQESQREFERVPIRVRVTLYLLRPNDSFTPLMIKGVATDFSDSGMRVKTPLLGEKECAELAKQTCIAKIEASETGTQDAPKLRGELFWAQYHPESPEERAYSELGFRLTNIDADAVRWLERQSAGEM